MRNKLQTHLALLTLDFAPDNGGVQNYLYESVKRLASVCQISVITPIPQGTISHPSFNRIVLNSITVQSLLKVLKDLQPDIVLVGHAHPKLLMAAQLYGRYALITYGNDYLAAQRRWHRPLFNWLVRRANPLITISQANVHKLNALNIKPDAVIYPGTDPLRFRPRQKTQPQNITLLTIARLVPRKGIDTVIRSLPTLLSHQPDLQYHIGGQGPDFDRLNSVANEAGVSEAIRFLGNISDEQLPSIYQSANIFVMPAREESQNSSVEGFGIVFLEASATGLPNVASHSGGIAEAVIDGTTGLLVQPDNVTELSEALLTLLKSSQKRAELGQNGRQWVEEKMNWEQTAKNLAQVLGIDVS